MTGLLLVAGLAGCTPEPPPTPAPSAGGGDALPGGALVPPPPPELSPVALDAGPPPAGIIGGEPILPTPIVLGAIPTADIDAGLGAQRGAIEGCYEARRAVDPTLHGKVLVKFSIARDGHVPSASVASTSLRDDATELCLLEKVRATPFHPLADGEMAIVRYPFTFPLPATSLR